MNTCYETGQNKSNNEENNRNFMEVLFYKSCNVLKTIQYELNAQTDKKLNVINSVTRDVFILRRIVSEYSEMATFFWLSGKYYECELYSTQKIAPLSNNYTDHLYSL